MDRLVHRLTLRRASRGDEGFTLVEVTVSLVLLAIVLTSALSLMVRALNNTDIQAQRQQAITIANDRLELVRSVPPSDLLDGRSLAAVTSLWTWNPNLVATSLKVSDTTVSATDASLKGLVKTVETLPKAKYDNIAYTVRVYVDRCYLPSASTVCGQTVTGKPMYRITVSVAWSPRGTRSCAEGVLQVLGGSSDRCQEYVVSTLRDYSSEPKFNTN